MQIYPWSNKIYNMQNVLQQSKPIALYKPILNINNILYSKLGDIVCQNTDYSLPSAKDFTLLIQTNTSDIKKPTNFELVVDVNDSQFQSRYYQFASFINNSTTSLSVILDNITNCISTFTTLNTR